MLIGVSPDGSGLSFDRLVLGPTSESMCRVCRPFAYAAMTPSWWLAPRLVLHADLTNALLIPV